MYLSGTFRVNFFSSIHFSSSDELTSRAEYIKEGFNSLYTASPFARVRLAPRQEEEEEKKKHTMHFFQWYYVNRVESASDLLCQVCQALMS